MSFRLIIAGSRDLFVSTSFLEEVVREEWSLLGDLEIVSGGCRSGIDVCGERFSREVLRKEPKVFPADWDKHGKAAGSVRNEQMARYADAAVVLMHDGRPTPGSSNMHAWMGLLEKPSRIVGVRG